MLKFLSTMFGGSEEQSRTSGRPAAQDDPGTQSLLHAIEVQRASDPLIGAKIGAKEVIQRLMTAFKNERGVHIESLLCALAAVAGYACQASVRAQALNAGMKEDALLTTVETTDGAKFFFGDFLNKALAGSDHSLWSLAGGAAQQNGGKNLPDLEGIFKHAAATAGSSSFGVPRIPSGHAPGDTPMNYLMALWPTLFPLTQKFCKLPQELPLLFALAIYDVMIMSKDVLAPDLAFLMVMECAVPMSKVDLSAHQ